MAKTPAEIELDHFWRGTGRYIDYGTSDESSEAATKIFLDRNVVFQRIIVGDVTEERIPHTDGGLQQMIGGEYYSANRDPEFWREAVTRDWERAKREVETALKSEAVLAYLDAKQQAEVDAEVNAIITRDRRRDELVNELAPRSPGLGGNWYMNVSIGLRKAVDRIIDLEGATK